MDPMEPYNGADFVRKETIYVDLNNSFLNLVRRGYQDWQEKFKHFSR